MHAAGMESMDQADADLASKLELTEVLLASPSSATLEEITPAEGNPRLRHSLSNAARTLGASIAATEDIFEVRNACDPRDTAHVSSIF